MAALDFKSIGIIGTGEIGWRIGKLLAAAGHHIVAYDIREEALVRPRASGFAIARNIPDLCTRSDLVITCVVDGASLRDVVSGQDGIAAHLPAGRPVIDTTSAEPWISRDLAVLLDRAGIPFLDAPVSGGVPAAEAGKMNFMIGGDAAVFERCRPVLRHLGPSLAYVGAAGAGHTIKAVNMLALAASMYMTSEMFAVGMRAGAPLAELVAAFDKGRAASFCTRAHYPRFIVPGNYKSEFSFDLMLKDLGIGIALADRLGLPLFTLRSIYEIYRAAANTGLHGHDNTRLVEPVLAAGAPLRNAGDIGPALETATWACNTVIAAEVLCLGHAAGLPSQIVLDVLQAGSGDTHALSTGARDYLRGAAGAPVTLAEVSVATRSVGSAVLSAGVPAPLFGQGAAIIAEAHQREGGDADARSVIDLVARWMGQADYIGKGRGDAKQ